jgi:hypothetical protein
MSRYSFWAVTVKRMIEAGEFGRKYAIPAISMG